MASSAISVFYHGGVAVVLLNRPRSLNALAAVHIYQLGQALRDIDKRDDIFITVITGKGRYFSAGADITSTDLTAEPDRRDITRGFVISNLDITNTFSKHSKILIFALNGPVIGMPAGLTGLADFIYATPQAFLLLPFSSLGLVTEGGSSVALVQRMGIAKATEALMLSRRMTSDELLATGFVNKIFTPPPPPSSSSLNEAADDDDDWFLKRVLEEIDDKMGVHLNRTSMLKIKNLIRAPYRDLIDQQNVKEVFGGLERFTEGIPRQEFIAIAEKKKRHKL